MSIFPFLRPLSLLRLKKYIQTQRGGKAFKIGFVFPMPGIRGTIKKNF